MRSSVTVMLSNPPVETTMSHPDYNQSAEDHQCLLIVVKQVGNQLKQKTFNHLYERISRLQYVRIQDSQGSGGRGIWVRYKRHYPVENNEWGDFQAHRKVLGLLCIGKCSDQSELEELCRAHEAAKGKYIPTLYDSRCIVYGYMHDAETPSVNSDSSVEDQKQSSRRRHPHSPTSVSRENNDDCLSTHSSGGSGEPSPQRSWEGITDKDSGVFSSLPVDGDIVASIATETVQNGLNSITQTTILQTPISSDPCGLSESERKRGHYRNMSLPTSPSRDLVFGSESASGVESCRQNLNFSLPPSPSCARRYVPSSGSSDSSSSASGPPLVAPANLKTQILFYPSVDDCSNLETDLNDFISSLFWVLESKRLDKSHEKLDRVPLLFAPCEKKDFVGLNLENRTNKKRSQGRMKKHIGDLSFLAGLPGDAINYYSVAADMLKSVSDWLWLAGCYEGLCTASAVTLYPHQHRKATSLQRNLSFTAGSSPQKPRAGTFSTRSLPNGVDPSEFKSKNCLSPDEIIEKYKEAIVHYSKYHNAAVIEMEANIKATKILILQEKCLVAAEFLQNLVFFKGQLSDEEKIQQFIALSQLYAQIGFHRKAALYRRIAALKCGTSQTINPNWTQGYYLLLQALEGYRLSVDPKEYSKAKGWPILQIHVLKDLAIFAYQMGNSAVSVRHMTFLLNNLFDHLTIAERSECCRKLGGMTAKCTVAPVPLALDNGFILPPVNLINLPPVKFFKLQNLEPHLRPMRFSAKPEDKSQCGPFIFSPLQFGKRKEINPNNNVMDFKWVEGEACAVALQVYNPLSIELNVTNMSLLPDGIAFETVPTKLSLPAMFGPYSFTLLGTPHTTGNLEILGYTALVYGVKSNCRLSELPSVRKPCYVVEVVPALPRIEVVTSLPKAATFSSFGDTSCIVASVMLSMYAGSRQECTITLINCGSENVEKLEIDLETKLEKDLERDFCTWSMENLQTQLPLLPKSSASFTIYVQAVGDLLSLAKAYRDESSESIVSSTTSQQRSSSVSSLSVGSLSSAVRSTINYSSFRRKVSDVPPPPSSPAPSLPHFNPKVIEMMLRIRYTGGPGMKADYCRHSTIVIDVEISPSILITKWDVLPAERPTHCYLVLDILNTTEDEMEVQYTTNKHISIEAKETCRIPVPVERCPMSKLSGLTKEEAAHACSQHVAGMVDIKWTIPSTKVQGALSIANLLWTPSMLDLIHMSPIQWEISLNDEPFKAEVEFTFILGEIINMAIAVTNYSETMLTNLNLKVDCYQDHQNGQYNFRLENRLAFIGCDYINITKIEVQETYTHHCGLLFFVPGVYKLDVQCSSGALKRRSSSTPQIENIKSNDATDHTWKCMRAIELTIAQK